MTQYPKSVLLLATALAWFVVPFSDARAEPVEAYTRARVDLRLAFVVSGRVAEVLVSEGQSVRAGDPIARLADPEGEAQIRLLTLRAQSTLEVDAAVADYELAQVREGMVKSAAERGGASAFEVRESELESIRARLAAELFEQRRDEAMLQLEQARERHAQFTLLAPSDGVIDEIIIKPGETVEGLEPIARLVAIDSLLTDAQVDTGDTLTLTQGGMVNVEFVIGENRWTAEGRIVYVAAVADAASDTRRVRVEIPNSEGRPAGTRVFLTFSNDPETR